MAHITLSRSAFFHNLSFLTSKLGGKEKLAIVLKDNAYGHGLIEIARLSSEFGISKAVVRTYDEANQIKDLFTHILILCPRAPHTIQEHYSVVINDLETLRTIPEHAKIDLKIDTGMHRNGLSAKDLPAAFELIKEKSLQLYGVMTHFRSADELGSEFFWQIKNWHTVKKRVRILCKKYALAIPLFHSANSAASLRLKRYEDDYARCGISAYGYHEMHPSFGRFDLQPVLALQASRISTIHLKKGERVGYGGAYTASSDMIVSTYDVGYGDGFFRFNAKGRLILNGKDVLGKISMDSLCLEGISPEVTLLKDAREIASYFDTISYDVLVKLSPAIRRIIIH